MLNPIPSAKRSRSSRSIAARGSLAGVLLALVALLALGSSPGCHSKAQPGESAFADPSYAKLDSDLRRLSKDLVADGHEDSVLAILVQLKGGSNCQSELEKAGMKVESTMGEVVTGRATVKALPQVAMIKDVVQIQAARTYRAGETEQ